MSNLFNTVIAPVVTEKSSALYGQLKEYTFRVRKNATKAEIREAVEQLFEVRVESVRTMQQRAKRRVQGKTVGTRPGWKKAYVRLKEGDSIEIFEG